jgi:hypothetical protein
VDALDIDGEWIRSIGVGPRADDAANLSDDRLAAGIDGADR